MGHMAPEEGLKGVPLWDEPRTEKRWVQGAGRRTEVPDEKPEKGIERTRRSPLKYREKYRLYPMYPTFYIEVKNKYKYSI